MEKNQKNNSQDFDFSVVEDKIQQVQNIIEKAVKSKDFQEMSQSVTQMVNKTLDQYRKEHPEMGKPERSRRLIIAVTGNREAQPMVRSFRCFI